MFGREGSIYMQNGKVELRKGTRRGAAQGVHASIRCRPERAEPVAYMVNALRNKKDIEGLTALDINVRRGGDHRGGQGIRQERAAPFHCR